MRIVAYSKALYSTWVYLETLRLLVDAGEGVNTHLEGRLLGIRDVALTHGHTDHFTGLHNVLITRLRALQQGQPLERLRILWPSGEPEIEAYLAYLQGAVLNRHPELAELAPLEAGARVPIGAVRGLILEPFAVRHRGSSPCFGYRVLRERWRLRPELAELPQNEIDRRAAEGGRKAVAAPVMEPLVVLSGDTRPLPGADMLDTELLIHEATFIGECLEESHSTLEEAVATWRTSGARYLLAYHFSSRYRASDIDAALDELVPDPEERARIGFVTPSHVFDETFQVAGL